ncbi:DUF6452 family protein [Flammeovirga sp. SJP92]|uniref:DUF6452 family protein n=1 Tax=Flammeovirga sp. SJP92 TaxID=1775430 RepID=UPI000786D040|nr:DUF6452 family protein [Flammeovirga sp. SJP92]KXX67093.1 hypothetical protein AVL50_29435 [Flammeovirga sp. SJP92]
MKRFLQLIIFTLIFTSCNDCEYGSEPTMNLQFTHDHTNHEGEYYPPDYDKVILAGSDSVLTFSHSLKYPLSIVSDTTTLIFSNNEQIDTLSIKYTRNFDFESKECGYTVTLSDFQNLKETTFDSVTIFTSTSSQSLLKELNRNEYYIIIYN